MANADSITDEIFTVLFQSHRITTTVTANPTTISNWIYNTQRTYQHHIRRDRLIVGLGIQWQPIYRRPPTLQLCVGKNCLIIQLHHAASVPNSLRKFLSDPSISFAGVWNHNDNAMLQKSRHNLSVTRLIELGEVAAEHGFPRRISMERLAASVLGINGANLKPDWVAMSGWEANRLNEEQVSYASIDAFISFLLGINLEVWNWKKVPIKPINISDWIKEIENSKKASDSDNHIEDWDLGNDFDFPFTTSDGLNPFDGDYYDDLIDYVIDYDDDDDPVPTPSASDEKSVQVEINDVLSDKFATTLHVDDHNPKDASNGKAKISSVILGDEEIIDPVRLITPSTGLLKNWSVRFQRLLAGVGILCN